MGYPLPSTDPLGTDLMLDQNGDLVVGINGDTVLVTQADNVGQAIRVQMTTNAVDYLWGDDCGSDLSTHVDQPITPYREEQIQSTVTTILERDPRILTVQGVSIDDSTPGLLLVTPEALVEAIGVVETPVPIGTVTSA